MALSLQRYSWSDFSSPLFGLLKERSLKEKERSTAIILENAEHLPESLIFEILTWLPVKDVLRFKSVCKSWYATISSRVFVSKHLENFCKNYNDSCSSCLLAQFFASHAELQLFELLVDETPRVLACEVLYSMPMYGSYVCGPCDGIYYLYNYDSGCRTLWNPAINEIKILPPLIAKPDIPSNVAYASNEVYGLGLDPVTGDYKVVVIKGYWSTTDEESEVSYPLSLLVYSLRSDSWRYAGDLSQDWGLENNRCYICLNGCFYWLGSFPQGDEISDVIVSYDVAADSFQEVDVPSYGEADSKSLAVHSNSLAFLTVHEIEEKLNVWTLNEGAWTKKFTIRQLSDIRNPVGHLTDEKLLLERADGKLISCDPVTNEVRDLGFMRNTWCQGIFHYMESLVSVKDTITLVHP